MKINIDKNVPIPEKVGRECKYPWRQMEIGDSFFIEGKRTNNMCSLIAAAGKRIGRKFISRTIGNGVRIWRIE